MIINRDDALQTCLANLAKTQVSPNTIINVVK